MDIVECPSRTEHIALRDQAADEIEAPARRERAVPPRARSADQAIAAAPIWHVQHRVLSEVIGGLKKSLGQLRRAAAAETCAATHWTGRRVLPDNRPLTPQPKGLPNELPQHPAADRWSMAGRRRWPHAARLQPGHRRRDRPRCPAGIADLDRALAAAQKGFEAWRDVPAIERPHHAAGGGADASADGIAAVLTQENSPRWPRRRSRRWRRPTSSSGSPTRACVSWPHRAEPATRPCASW